MFLVTNSKSRQEFDIEVIDILKSMYAYNASYRVLILNGVLDLTCSTLG